MISILEGGRDPIQECRMLLLAHPRWLLVLDGMRSTDDWETINATFCLSRPTPGSRTIVITNEQSVAKHCVNKDDKQVISVQGLEGAEALNLFKEKIHKKNIDKEPSDMERFSELSESIMTKCGGLPKVISAVAEHYMSSDKRTYLKLKDINDNFMNIVDGLHSLRGLFSWMQHYLETCKDDLKPCIFYLPVFPIGHNIRLRRLQMRWTAEGYIRDKSSHTTEKNTIRLFDELWEFSMFQEQLSSKPIKCQVNGFLHEYINSRPMEDNLVFALEGPCGMQLQRAGGLHLTIRDNWDRDMNVFRSIDFSRVRSLTVFGECRPFMFDPVEIKMRYVRVLDLEDALGVTNSDLKHIVEVFPRLKFLSLRGCRKITHLPKSLGCLRQLQTLDIRHTSVATLPKAILKIQKLQYVRAGTILSAPWDEGGTMVQYQTKRPEKIISTSVPAQDGTTFAAATVAAAPSTPAEDATTVVGTPLAASSEDITTIVTAPLAPAEEDAAAAVEAAPSALAEDATTAVATQLAASSEDITKIVTAPLSPAGVATTVEAAPSALEEDATTGTTAALAQGAISEASLAPVEGTIIVVTDPIPPLAEDATIVAASLSTSAADTTLAAVPVAPLEGTRMTAASLSPAADTTIVAVVQSALAEDVTTVAAAPMARAEDGTMVAASPSAPVQGATAISVAHAEDSSTAAAAPRRRPHALVPGWLSKLGCRSRLDNTNLGVDVPAGIGKLTTLHTFGVANVGPRNKSALLKELHKLTHLCRLSVCGINLENIHEFFSSIAGLNHLLQLSVRLDRNMDGLFSSLDGTVARPPKTLDERLKLQGHVRILGSSWIKDFADVSILDLEVTIQEQDDMQVILDHLIHRTNGPMKRLCIKPIQDGELGIGINDEREVIGLHLDVLEIVCTTNLLATIGNIVAVDVLKVQCSSGSSLQLYGLQRVRYLKEVWLKGSCSDAFKQGLQRQLDQHRYKDKPVHASPNMISI